jgi:hypothetical protein
MTLKGAYFELVNSQQFVTSEDGPDAQRRNSAVTESTAPSPAGAPLGTIGEGGAEHAATDATEVLADAGPAAAPPAYQAVVHRNSSFRDSEV